MKRPIDRYVDSLLRRRRPKAFAPNKDDVAIARTAIELAAAAAPDAQHPREAFVEELRRRIAEQQDDPRPASVPAATVRPRGRRRFLAATALTATGVAATVAVDRAVMRPASQDADPELTPTVGGWQTVAAAADLPEGGVLAFDVGAVSGFVRRVSGPVQAVSGACTHQGCRLRHDTSHDQLACPCHGATFSLAGAPLTRPHGSRPLPPALPRLAVRVEGGRIQVYRRGPLSDSNRHAGSAVDFSVGHQPGRRGRRACGPRLSVPRLCRSRGCAGHAASRTALFRRKLRSRVRLHVLMTSSFVSHPRCAVAIPKR